MALREVRKDCVPTAPVTITINLSNQSVKETSATGLTVSSTEHPVENKTINVEVKRNESVTEGSSSANNSKPTCVGNVCCSSGNHDGVDKTVTTGTSSIVIGQTEIYPRSTDNTVTVISQVETNNTCTGVVSSSSKKKVEEPTVEVLPSCQCYTISRSQGVYFSSQQEKIRYHIQSVLELYGMTQAKQISEILGNETLLKEFLKQTPVTVYTTSRGEKCLNKDGTGIVNITS
jgi:hypothetical protein